MLCLARRLLLGFSCLAAVAWVLAQPPPGAVGRGGGPPGTGVSSFWRQGGWALAGMGAGFAASLAVLAAARRRWRRELAGVRARAEAAERALEVAGVGGWEREGDPGAGRFVVSAEAARLLGVSGVSAGEDDWLATLDADDRAALTAELARLEPGGAWTRDVWQAGPENGRWLRFRARREAGARGGRCVGVVEDVTEPRRREEQLRRSEALLRRAVTLSPMPVMLHAEDGEVVMVSEAWAEAAGYARTEIPTVADWVAKAYGPEANQIREEIGRLYGLSGRVHEGEHVVRTKAGEERTWEFMSSALGALPDGRRLVLSTAVDITERKRAEATLRENEIRYRTLIEHAPSAIFVGRAGRVVLANRACLRLFAATAEQLIGRRAEELFHPESCRFATGGGDGLPAEGQIVRLDGALVHVEIAAVAITDQASRAVHVMLRDISVHKRAADALRRSEESLAITLQSIGDGVIATHAGGGITRMNPTAERMTGWTFAEAAGRPLAEVFCLINARTRAPAPDPVQEVLASGAVVELATDTALAGRHARERRISVSAAPIRDTGGGIVGVVLVFNDVTAVHRVHEALRESEARARRGEERLELALEGAELGLWDWNVATGEANYDARWCAMLGHAAGELPPRVESWQALVHPDDAADAHRRLEAHLRGETPRYESEHRLRHRNGGWRWVLNRGKVIARDGAGAPLRMAGTHMDVTARRRVDEALRTSLHEKEALLKEVHHRVKNNLQVITSLLRLEAGRLEHPVTRGVLQEMQNRIRSMALLHETLYRSGNFARIDLGGYVESLGRHLLRSTNGAARAVELRVEAEPVSLSVEQAVPCGLIVTELASNCLKHAFPSGGGEIRVEVGLTGGGTHLRLAVADDGVGLPADLAERQTRSLGLQLVSDLVGQLGGHVEIASRAPAVFEVVFPYARPAGERAGEDFST